MIQKANLEWTPDRKIKSMKDVRVALATSGFDFSKGKQGRLGKEIIISLILLHCSSLYTVCNRSLYSSLPILALTVCDCIYFIIRCI